jgi:hypothetical protein
VWSTRTGKRLHILQPTKETTDEELAEVWRDPLATSFAPGGNRYFVATFHGLQAWDLPSGQQVAPFEKQELDWGRLDATGLSLHGLAFSGDGRFAARLLGRLWLYEVASGRIIHHFPGPFSAMAFHPSRPRLAVASMKHLDTLVYDLGLLFRLPATGRHTLQELWADLAHTDAVRAQRALWTLAVAPGMEDLLAGKLKPVDRLDPGRLKSHLAALRSDDFATRRKAELELAKAGDAARAALLEASRGSGDLEHRLRLQRLLARISPRAPDRLRQHRAILALETRSSKKARRLLARLARGMPGATLTEEAKAALERLTRSAGVAP